MPYLKDKIAKAISKNLQASQTPLQAPSQIKIEPLEVKSQLLKPKKISENNKPSKALKTPKGSAEITPARKSANSAKNIVKNFGRAMVTFAISKVAVPYIEEKLKELNLSYQAFHRYLFQRKENMDGISSLRGLILVESHDDDETAAIKMVFQYTSEIFLKYFSVNWIYNSKLGDKLAHVKSRFKILRRIRKPEHFTYFRM